MRSAVLSTSPRTGREGQGAGKVFEPSRGPMGHPGSGLDHGKAHIMNFQALSCCAAFPLY